MSPENGFTNTREIVLSMLAETLDHGEFSHRVLNRAFSTRELNLKDRIFAARLFHGVLERSIFLDWIIRSYSNVKFQKIKPVIRNILRMSIYQILFMDTVPDHAAIDEAVKLAKSRGLKGLAPFVNGILRAFLRGGIKPGMPEAVKCSVPFWLYDRMVLELGKKDAEAMFAAACEPKGFLYVRMALSRAPAEDIIQMLERDGCETERVSGVEEALKLKPAGSLQELDAFRQGLCMVQDLSSIHVGKTAAELADPKQVKKILDVCAAPGGKSLHLAEQFPAASVLARDLSEEKVRLIEENIQRSAAGNLKAEVFDALVMDETKVRVMDLVLADLPCSGLGVIGRKPDIKLRLKEEDLAALAALQREILGVVWRYVKPGGILIYSTCTVNRQENQENAGWFEKEFPFENLYEKQFVPGKDECDGFYLTVFRRKKAARRY